jgi:hypothetical protein
MAKAGRPLWAGIIFNSGPSASEGADYTIRMYYTVVPQTFVAVRQWHGISRRYKEYFTSGFLSLQAAIDAFLMGTEPEQEASLVVPPPGLAQQQARVRAEQAEHEAQQQREHGHLHGGHAQHGGDVGAQHEWQQHHAWREPLGGPAYNVWATTMPSSAYVFNRFYHAVGSLLGLLLCLSMMFPLAMMIK